MSTENSSTQILTLTDEPTEIEEMLNLAWTFRQNGFTQEKIAANNISDTKEENEKATILLYIKEYLMGSQSY